MSKPTFEDRRKLEAKENKLQEMRTQSKMKRDVTIAVSARGFYRSGIMCDIIQVRNVDPDFRLYIVYILACNVNTRVGMSPEVPQLS